jgi:fructokinase
MGKTIDVVALGEMLIDFTTGDKSEQGNQLFEACPGGAPCNVLAMLNSLGRKTAFIGKVGQDQFCHLLKETIEDAGIISDGLVLDKKVNTTLAFVHTFPDGDREFSFYRNPGADMMLAEDEVNYEVIKSAKVFHFGTLSMTDEPVKSATKSALKLAKEEGLLVTFDPNLRPPLWQSLDDAKVAMEYGFGFCDVLKISDNEIQFVTGEEDYDTGIRILQEKYNIPLIFLTLGKDGARAYYKDLIVERKGFKVNTIESTGAGDTFCGCMINGVLETGIDNFTEEKLGDLITYANAGAAIITTRKGAIRSMPTRDEIDELLEIR